MVDPRDLGHTLGDRKDAESAPSKGVNAAPGFDPTVFVYDRMPGGVGLAPRLYDEREELLRRTVRLLERCVCDSGCPACVGVQTGMPLPAAATAGPQLSRRKIALAVLADLGIGIAH